MAFLSTALNGPELAVLLLLTRQTLPKAIVQPDALRAHTCNFGADPLLPLCSQTRLKKENLSSLFASKRRRRLQWQQQHLFSSLLPFPPCSPKVSLSGFSQRRKNVS